MLKCGEGRSKRWTPPVRNNLPPEPKGPLAAVIRFSLHNKLFVLAIFGFLMLLGVFFAPFDWNINGVERAPIAVDAIPDIGENQQIVFTEWSGRSPQGRGGPDQLPAHRRTPGDARRQGGPRHFDVRLFDGLCHLRRQDRFLLEPNPHPREAEQPCRRGRCPTASRPGCGPDATALGQVFWYTLEGLGPDGKPTGGWDPDELRSIQDWQVRYQLLGIPGVSEVASIGGFVREYQVDADPAALRQYGVTFGELVRRGQSRQHRRRRADHGTQPGRIPDPQPRLCQEPRRHRKQRHQSRQRRAGAGEKRRHRRGRARAPAGAAG